MTVGDGNSPPGFTYRAAGGMEAIIIGSTRWIRLPGDPGWEKQEGATVVLPSEWDEEYSGATGFTLLGEETIDGERCRLLAFVVPELTEPGAEPSPGICGGSAKRRATCARRRWSSRLHYMLNSSATSTCRSRSPHRGEAATPVASGTPVS